MLCNRVRKNGRRLRKWRRREGVQCFRLYDRDIPEIPLVIDWYQGRLHVAERSRTSDLGDEHSREEWMRGIVAKVARELEVAEHNIFYKVRTRQRGQRQYQALGVESHRIEVAEGGYRFWVNLVDYIDTGLFLDHRQTRAMVAAEAAGKSFLNLFCYTGSFQVYAAMAGAATTVGIDLSATYLAWARENMDLNGLSRERNRLVRGDVQQELIALSRVGEKFDLIVVDPPTFSNSKRLDDVFDVQRDHGALLRAVRAVLAPGGSVYFSTNHRRFRLDEEGIGPLYDVEDISEKTLPPDYRDTKIHRCWRMVARTKRGRQV